MMKLLTFLGIACGAIFFAAGVFFFLNPNSFQTTLSSIVKMYDKTHVSKGCERLDLDYHLIGFEFVHPKYPDIKLLVECADDPFSASTLAASSKEMISMPQVSQNLPRWMMLPLLDSAQKFTDAGQDWVLIPFLITDVASESGASYEEIQQVMENFEKYGKPEDPLLYLGLFEQTGTTPVLRDSFLLGQGISIDIEDHTMESTSDNGSVFSFALSNRGGENKHVKALRIVNGKLVSVN